MDRKALLWWGLGGAALWYLIANRSQVTDTLQSGVEDVTAALTGWKSVGQGPRWLPVLNAAEVNYGIPADLLARLAYQESHFRQDIIDGSTASPAGALGIMQMMPQYFPVVTVPRPFSDTDTTNQIAAGAAQLASLYTQFGDWGLALAAYNDGAGNVNSYLAGTRALPAETQNYVADILADVPVPGAQMVS